jgi:outer membrane murein-binding lipoprotein Lpp
MSKKIALALVTLITVAAQVSYAQSNSCVSEVRRLNSNVRKLERNYNSSQSQYFRAENNVLREQFRKLSSVLNISVRESSSKAAARWFQGTCLVTVFTGGFLGCQDIKKFIPDDPDDPDATTPGPDQATVDGKIVRGTEKKIKRVCVDSAKKCVPQSIALEAQVAALTAQRKVRENLGNQRIMVAQTRANRLAKTVTDNQTKLDTAQAALDLKQAACDKTLANLSCVNSYIKQCRADVRVAKREVSTCYR